MEMGPASPPWRPLRAPTASCSSELSWSDPDAEITRGGVLEFNMGPDPNQDRGSAEADAPPDHFQ